VLILISNKTINNMKKIKLIMITLMTLLAISCKKENKSNNYQSISGSTVETTNGITYRIYVPTTSTYKGILVLGSGNDENNPSVGSLDGSTENELCKKAADNGYLAAVVQYSKTPGNSDWNASAVTIAKDFAKCIEAIAGKYNVAKTKSVVGGYSYASFMLLTAISIDNSLDFCQGVLAACGASGEWNAQNFHIPIYAVNCSGNNEGDFNGLALYNKIPAVSAIKAKSGGYTDNSCSTHCGGDWTNLLFTKLQYWLP
jgi:hypothetical protein